MEPSFITSMCQEERLNNAEYAEKFYFICSIKNLPSGAFIYNFDISGGVLKYFLFGLCGVYLKSKLIITSWHFERT